MVELFWIIYLNVVQVMAIMGSWVTRLKKINY